MSPIERLARDLCKGYAERLIEAPVGWNPSAESLQSYVDRHWEEWLWAAKVAHNE